MRKLLLTILFLLIPAIAHAAVGVQEACEPAPSTAQANTYECGAFGPDNNDRLIAFACVSDTVDDATMSGGGLTWTQIAKVTYGSHTAYAFWADAGASAPGSVNPTIDVTGDEGTGAVMIAYQVSGADADPVEQFKTATATSTNPTVTMDAAFDAANGAFAIACGGYTAPFVTEINGGNWNEQMDAGYSTPTNAGSSGYLVGESGSTVTFTNGDSVQHGVIAVELCADGTCTGGAATPTFAVFEAMGEL